MAEFLLEWTFTPADLFEERTEFPFQGGVFVVEAGKVEARIPEDAYSPDHSLRTELHEELSARFLAAQVLGHKPFTLTKPSVTRLHPDGRKDAWLFAEPATLTLTGGNADFILTDAAGNVTRDTKKERIDRRNGLANAAASSADDPVVNSILRSYSAAVNDPGNELVHLYEVRDALATHFGGKDNALQALKVEADSWSMLGRLANDEPLAQGRHRGKKLGTLRDATKEELQTVREIARSLIEAYLKLKANPL